MEPDDQTPERLAALAEADEDDERMGSLWSMSNSDWQKAHWRLTLPILLAILVGITLLSIWLAP